MCLLTGIRFLLLRLSLTAYLVYWAPRLYEQYRLAMNHIVPAWYRDYGAIDEDTMEKRIAEVKTA